MKYAESIALKACGLGGVFHPTQSGSSGQSRCHAIFEYATATIVYDRDDWKGLLVASNNVLRAFQGLNKLGSVCDSSSILVERVRGIAQLVTITFSELCQLQEGLHRLVCPIPDANEHSLQRLEELIYRTFQNLFSGAQTSSTATARTCQTLLQELLIIVPSWCRRFH